jgi:hypothetical protein
VKDKVTFGSRFLGNRLIVHNNRVEVIAGCWPFRRKRAIPFSSISSVETAQIMNQVIIHTNDGEKVKYSVGNKNKIRDAILERM